MILNERLKRIAESSPKIGRVVDLFIIDVHDYMVDARLLNAKNEKYRVVFVYDKGDPEWRILDVSPCDTLTGESETAIRRYDVRLVIDMEKDYGGLEQFSFIAHIKPNIESIPGASLVLVDLSEREE